MLNGLGILTLLVIIHPSQMLLFDSFLIPQDLSESEDELLNLKIQTVVSKKHNLVSPFDMSPIQPRKLREAEQLKLGFDMEKLLLERVKGGHILPGLF